MSRCLFCGAEAEHVEGLLYRCTAGCGIVDYGKIAEEHALAPNITPEEASSDDPLQDRF